MAHAPNRTHLPPVKSAEEYEREIAELKAECALAHRALCAAKYDRRYTLLGVYTQACVNTALRTIRAPCQ